MTFGPDGKLAGRYDSAIHTTIPEGAVQVTDELFARTINETDGVWKLVSGAVIKTDAVVAPSVPARISMAQACLALYQSNLLDAVEALIAAQGRAAQIEWERRQNVERNHPLVQLAKSQLPLTESQLDDLFALGASL